MGKKSLKSIGLYGRINIMKRKLIQILLPLIFLTACLVFSACGAPERLSAPANLKIENGVLTWDEVEYADGYSVYFKDREYETEECRFELTGLEDTETFPIEVMAFSNTGISHSEYSVITYAGKYALPTEGLGFARINNSENSDECRVVKFAADENGVCVIPAFYGELRVVSLAPAEGDGAVGQIKSLYLPNTINGELFETTVFSRFPNLENIELEAGLLRYESKANCIIDKTENSVVVGCIDSGFVDSVTKIGEGAFFGRNIKIVSIPRQITVIESYAFSNCPLEAVYYDGTAADWAEKVTVSETGNGTFLSKLCYYSENEPSESGNYWHNVGGVLTRW